MTDHSRRKHPARGSTHSRPSIDEQLLARAAAINESVAAEFADTVACPLENPLLAHMEGLGVETNAAVSVALQRAHRIAFHMRRGRSPRDSDEVTSDAEALSAEERAQVAALAVAWWDGVLTVLRAGDLERRAEGP